MIEIRKYFDSFKVTIQRIFLELKSLLNRDIYKKENIIKTNIELGIHHIQIGNFNDAIFRFYLVTRFLDKNDRNAKRLLAWAYFIKKDVNRAIKEISQIKSEDNIGFNEYLLNYKSYDVIPPKIVDIYKNFTLEYIYIKYFNDKISLSKLLIDELLNYLKAIPKDFKILDLGCKSGLIGAEIDYLIDKKYLIHGVESNQLLSKRATIISNSSNGRIYDEVINIDIETYIKDVDSQYDSIIAFDSLSYRKNFRDLFIQIKPILRKNGCFILLLKKSNATQISDDLISFEYQENDVREQLVASGFSVHNIKTYYLKKNKEYFIIIAN